MRVDVLVFDHSKFAFAALKAFLIQYGYTVVLASNLAEAQRKMNNRVFDLVIVQETIRQAEILELNSYLKDVHATCYLLVLMKNFSVNQRIEVLEAGADDCLSLPYHPKELLLKMEKLLQHKHAIRENVIKTSKYELNVISGDLLCPWGTIWLRKKEFMIMSMLLQQKNRVVSKEQLIERIWSQEEIPQLSTIDVHIRRIREKIKDAEKNIIKTAHGVGYMFCE
ncbi:MAG: response regulator transcription factor [Patescibacteria group bacterium]